MKGIGLGLLEVRGYLIEYHPSRQCRSPEGVVCVPDEADLPHTVLVSKQALVAVAKVKAPHLKHTHTHTHPLMFRDVS
jgi:hypothetical protein